jgi:TonB family protein
LSESNAVVSSNTLNPAVSKQPSERTRTITAEPPPPAPEPKRSVVGNVQLAKPVVNAGAATRENGESSPSIDANQPSNGENLSNLGAAHTKGPDAPLPVGGDVKQAQLIKSVPPIYPSMARTQHISGNVKIDALIDASGNVSSMSVLSGPAMLHQAALAAVKQWRYQPAELDGRPTSMHLTVTVQFRLQ